MQKMIEITMTVVIFSVGFFVLHGCDNKSKKSTPEKTERQLTAQETDSTNGRLKDR